MNIEVRSCTFGGTEIISGYKEGKKFRYLWFHNFVQENHLILLKWHRFLNKLVILNKKSLDEVLMLLRCLNFQWHLIEAFYFKDNIFFEEVTKWSGIFHEIRDKFSKVINHTKKSLYLIN